MTARVCKHRRIDEVIEERYEPLFGYETPVEVIVHRKCVDCGAKLPNERRTV